MPNNDLWTEAAPSASSVIAVRNGTLASEGEARRYVATRLDSTEVEFAPDHNAASHERPVRSTR